MNEFALNQGKLRCCEEKAAPKKKAIRTKTAGRTLKRSQASKDLCKDAEEWRHVHVHPIQQQADEKHDSRTSCLPPTSLPAPKGIGWMLNPMPLSPPTSQSQKSTPPTSTQDTSLSPAKETEQVASPENNKPSPIVSQQSRSVPVAISNETAVKPIEPALPIEPATTTTLETKWGIYAEAVRNASPMGRFWRPKYEGDQWAQQPAPGTK